MRVEPEIDHQRLKAYLDRHYGIRAKSLTYIPQGEVGYNYILQTERSHAGGKPQGEDPRYILKLFDASRLASLAADRMSVAIPLLLELRERHLLTQVPRPVTTLDHQPTSAFDGYTVAMLSYVAGQNPDDATLHRSDIWAQLAGHVARLHRSTDSIRTPCPYVESYDLPFEGDLVRSMRELEQASPGARQGIRDLRELLLPQKGKVADLLRRTQALASRARCLAPPQVLCHTDIHAMNLLIDDCDILTLLDWEGVKLAPAEHDLFAFTGPDFPDFVEAYWRAGGVGRLHADVIGFYLHRRNLEDLTDWLVRILHENNSQAQDEADLAGIRSECMEGWPHLGAATERVRQQLARLAA